ncbi:MAG: AraC family transcriptional regulator [Deltaproteobacteria bacterium]|nr:AraC family transcriptional regulator [Candidatus Tharpella aukensis]
MYLTKLASVQLVAWKIMEAQNIDPASVFKEVRLNPLLMYQPGARYPLEKITDLWKKMEKRIKDPCFGLMAAEPKYCHPSFFGILGYAMLVSTSLRVALERLIRFHRVISDANFGRLDEDKDAGTLIFTLANIDETSYTQAREDAAIAWIMSTLRINFQDDIAVVSVNFTHSSSECAGKYYEFFKSPIYFDSPVASLVLSLELADRVLPSANEELAQFDDQIMTKYLTSLDEKDLLIKAKKIIVEHLPSGSATVGNIASELGYSTRTFQRLLHQKGTTFLALLNEIRMQIAKKYVWDKNMDLTEVAFLLGFAELSTFSRSFKRWTGKSLSQYRKSE